MGQASSAEAVTEDDTGLMREYNDMKKGKKRLSTSVR